MKTYQQFINEAYDRSTGRPHRGTDYKGRDYGGDDKPTVKIPLSGVMQGGWLEKKKKEKRTVKEAGDWWHPDPEQDKKMPGRGPKLRAKEDRGQDTSTQTKPDYSNRLKPGESYMDFAKRKSRGESVEFEIEEGMTMKDFKQQRSRQKQKDKREAEKTSPLRGRAGIHDDKASPERAARHRANVDPDFEGNDERNYPGGKLKDPKKIRKAKALGELGEEYIDETSLTRVMSKSKKGGMAIMSAQRGDKSKAENKARSRQLEKDVRGAGLPGPTKVAGRYTENPGTPQEKKVGEKSHVITPGKMGKRKFKKTIEKLGKKYNQDSVLIQRKGGGEATLKGTSKTSWPGKGKNVKIGSMKPGRTGEFDTKVKNKTFTVEQ